MATRWRIELLGRLRAGWGDYELSRFPRQRAGDLLAYLALSPGRATAREVLNAPGHPYTRALVETIPVVGMDRSVRLKAIEGMVPSPLDWPDGCRFAPRCDYAFDRCRTDDPRLLPVPPQESACWLCAEGRRTPGVTQVAR